MNRKGILLIGGNGFLGTALAPALAAEGREVHVLSRSAESGCRKGIQYYRGGQDETQIVLPLLKKVNTVVHLASTTTPGSPAASPVMEIEKNLLPAARLLEIMESSPPARLLFVSSGGSVYGNPEQLPASENHATSPISRHAAGKVSLESFFTCFAHDYNIPLAILRPSNFYGPGQSLRQGFGIVRTLLEKIKQGEPIEIRGDGSAVRDYLYIDDAVDACRRLIDTHSATGPYNAGSGRDVSIKTLVSLCCEITGHSVPVVHHPAPNSDVRAIVLDSSRLEARTGWRPSWSLEDGLRQTWDWLCHE